MQWNDWSDRRKGSGDKTRNQQGKKNKRRRRWTNISRSSWWNPIYKSRIAIRKEWQGIRYLRYYFQNGRLNSQHSGCDCCVKENERRQSRQHHKDVGWLGLHVVLGIDCI